MSAATALRTALRQLLTPHLVVAGICLLLFIGLAEEVVNNGRLVLFDSDLSTWVHDRTAPGATVFFRVITVFGSQVIYALGVIAGLFYIWRRQLIQVILWTITLVGGHVLSELLKELFSRPRPVFENPLAVESTFSFPSGHAMLSLIAYGMLTCLVLPKLQNRRARLVLISGMTLLVVLIGISRIYLRVHYFSDVVGGFAAGGVWLTLCIALLESTRQNHARRRQVVDGQGDTLSSGG